jgi:hypothetical protein
VTNVEAQRGAWQGTEDLSQVGNRLSNWLSLIHVFDTEKLSKASPFTAGVDEVSETGVSGS